MITRAELAAMVDHTLLKPESTAQQVADLAREAADLGAYSICVSPSRLDVELPEGVKLATVCGFPSGAHPSEVKAVEAADSVAQGADEVDMVINLGLAMDGDWDGVQEDIEAVRLMAETVGGRLGVKASGGIRTTEAALAMIDAGATRLGLSGTASVLEGLDS